MKAATLLFLILAGLSFTLAQTPQSRPLSPFEQELINHEKQFLEAFQNKNVAYVSEAVSEDFKGIAMNGDSYEREEMVGGAREGLPKDFRIYDVQVVRLDDSCAVVTYNSIVPGSRPRYRHVSDTWTMKDGQWKLRFEQETPNLWSAQDLD